MSEEIVLTATYTGYLAWFVLSWFVAGFTISEIEMRERKGSREWGYVFLGYVSVLLALFAWYIDFLDWVEGKR